MHVIFIPYGIESAVKHTLADMSAQKFQFPLINKKTGEVKEMLVQGSIRLLPFGIYEYVFPKEHEAIVLTTLKFHEKDNRYKIPEWAMKMCRMVLKLEPIPEFKPSKALPWVLENVAIIPMGVRYDAMTEHTDKDGVVWQNEAL